MSENTTPTPPPFHPQGYSQSQSQSPPYPSPQPAVAPAPVYVQQAPPRRSRALRILGGLLVTFFLGLFVLSVVMNVFLLVMVGAQSADAFQQQTLVEGKDNQVVAVYGVLNVIGDEQAKQFEKFYRQVADDENVRAVVLRVDSPGGGIAACDRICSMVRKLKTEHGKIVVVSMGGVAASGGYYISAPADEIFAETTTITGSIGVLANWIVVKGTLEKIGAEAIIMRSSHARGWKADINPFEKPDDRQRAHLQSILDEMQEQFESVVREGRGDDRLNTRKAEYKMIVGDGDDAREITHTEIEPFNGKVYMADEALERGLIDAKGDLQDAIKRAGVLARLSKPKVVQYAPHPSVLEKLLSSAEAGGGVKIDRELLDEFQTPQILMLWKVE